MQELWAQAGPLPGARTEAEPGAHAGERKAGLPLEGAQEQEGLRPRLWKQPKGVRKFWEETDTQEAMPCLVRACKAGVPQGP